MNNQDTITYLKRYKKLDQEIKRLLEQKEMWFTRACKVTQTITDMPRGGDGEDSRQKAICKMMELDQEVNIEIDKLVEMRKEIKTIINTVESDDLRFLLKLRYIDGKTFEEIAVLTSYCWKQTHRMHSNALSLIKMSENVLLNRDIV